jgi:thiol-disulfide isomerase/thioredoxin
MKIKFLIICTAVALATGCANNRKAEQFAALPFPAIVPPAMMENPQDRVEYMAMRWFDQITDLERTYPCDTLLVSGVKKGDVEQNFANWTNVLDMVGIDHARRSVSHLYDRVAACEKKDTSSNLFEIFTDLMIKYLYDPNSPLRNEDYYSAYSERLSKSDLVDPLMREKYARETSLSALNRVGTKAADFRFMDKRGKSYNLYGIKSDYILLFFSNPGCHACKEIIDGLNGDPKISALINEGVMKVLNIYIDEDLEAWRSYMPIYPDRWYNGFDPDLAIRGESLYNVRAIPSLYLLDKEKVVLMKDAPENRLFDYLSRL